MTRERLPRWLAGYCALLAVAAFALSALASCQCIECLHEGPWRFVGPPAGAEASYTHLQACSAAWAGDTVPYVTPPFESITWVKVQGSAIRSGNAYAEQFGAFAQTRGGDTILIASDYWSRTDLRDDELLHVLQNHHPQIALGDWYVPALWAACGVPLPLGVDRSPSSLPFTPFPSPGAS